MPADSPVTPEVSAKRQEVVNKAIGEVTHIATLPEITVKIFEVVENADSTAQDLHKIIINDPARVAREIQGGVEQVRSFRKEKRDAYYFNWLLRIEHEFQQPFRPTHERMRALKLHKEQPAHLLAANLRRAFSGVVAGNVKDEGIREIEKHGSFEIHGDPAIMEPMDALMASFVAQGRMKLPGKKYNPCYRIVAAKHD